MAMAQRIAPLLGVLLCLLGSGTTWAQSPSCDDPVLGSGACLPWGFNDLGFALPGEIVDLSRDGSVVVGAVGLSGVYRWKLGSGASVVDLPGSEGLTLGRRVVSANGSIVVGESYPAPPLASRVFRWDVENDTTLLLPSGPTIAVAKVFPNRTNGAVAPAGWPSVSADGDTIVGYGTATDGVGTRITDFWNFRWTAGGGTTDIPQEAFSTLFIPNGVAGDGLAVIGRVNDSGSLAAAVWRPGPMPAIGTGTNLGVADSEATAVSYDGGLVAGFRPDLGSGIGLAFTWSQGAGVANVADEARPGAVSDDGSIITGVNFAPLEPWISDPVEHGSLFDYLANQYGVFGFSYGVTFAPLGLVSGDGNVYSMMGARWVAKVDPINFVSLGDSYSSGEGVPPFQTGTASPGGNECHRSLEAYSTLIRPRGSYHELQLLADPGAGRPGFTWASLACSGATTRNVRSTDGSPNLAVGQWPGSTVEGIDHGLSQLNQGVVDTETDLVTITIGGNDALFSDVAYECWRKSDCRTAESPSAGMQWSEYFFKNIRDRVKAKVVATYEQIKMAAPNAAIVVLGYPLPVSGNECIQAARFSLEEQEFLQLAGLYLNRNLKAAATEVGVHFLAVEDAFDGHQACGPYERWMTGIVPSNQTYSFHPNEKGQEAYARAVTAFLKNTGIEHPHGFYGSGLPKNPPPQP